MSMSAMPPAASPAKKKPGAAGIIIGIVLMILGPVIGIVIIVMGVAASTSGLSSASTFGADGSEHEVQVTEGQTMGIWVGPDITSGQCQVWDSAGNNVTVSQPAGSTTVNGYDLQLSFVPTKDDWYSVACLSDDQVVWTYKVAGTLSVGGTVASVGGGVVVIFATGLAGLILLIVTLVRRSGWKKKYGAGAVGYPGAGGAPATGAPQGYYGSGQPYAPAGQAPGPSATQGYGASAQPATQGYSTPAQPATQGYGTAPAQTPAQTFGAAAPQQYGGTPPQSYGPTQPPQPSATQPPQPGAAQPPQPGAAQPQPYQPPAQPPANPSYGTQPPYGTPPPR